jgi:uncharacterized protein
MIQSDRIALVTGASSGIGQAAAVALAREGWRVVLVARGRAALDETAARIRETGAEAHVEAVDAADGAAVLEMAGRVRASAGVPHLIVNSAGAGAWRYVEETPPAEAVEMMGAPYLAAFNVTHAFMADLLRRGSGHVIHVGSPASRIPWPGATGYIAARWALRGLHEALSQDLRGTGVHSSHVVFGKVSSNYFSTNAQAEERLPWVGRLMRVLSPEDCARVLVGVARRPRREVVVPWMLRAFYAIERAAPGLARWLACVGSGSRRPAG